MYTVQTRLLEIQFKYTLAGVEVQNSLHILSTDDLPCLTCHLQDIHQSKSTVGDADFLSCNSVWHTSLCEEL